MSDTSGPGTLSTAEHFDEHALIEAAKNGDAAAMNQLLARHWQRVDKLCRRMMYNAFDAEDARQEALTQAARRIGTFQGRSSFGTWIYAVTRNVCLNEIQKASRHPTVPFDEEFDHPVTADAYGRVSQRLDIDAAMREVSPAYHAVLVMWFFGDMSLNDIAADLAVPVNTVKTRLFKGKAQLARLLGEPDGPAPLSKQEANESGAAGQRRNEPR